MHRSNGRGARTDRGRARRRGFTIVELMVAFGALLIVLLGFSRMLLSTQMASSTTHEATLAKEAARAMVETLQASRFDQVYARYNSSPGDDPGGGVTSPGASFAVRGLEAPQDDPDGLPGEILFPEQGGALTENLNFPHFGWTDLDLNGDGDHDDANVSNEYRFLPVLVRVDWRGSGGSGRVELKTFIGNY